jgi:hypothetical protein
VRGLFCFKIPSGFPFKKGRIFLVFVRININIIMCRIKRITFMRYNIILWSIFLMAVFSYVSFASAQPAPCLPVSGSPKSLEGYSIKPGKYRLTLVATAGDKKGAIVHGYLILKPTSHDDVSPKTGKRALKDEDLSETPLYGSVDIDFQAVSAPVLDLSRSIDPIYPDVLVNVIDWNGVKRQPVVFIGSVGNRRDRVMSTDGSGIGLFLQEINENSFAGVWDACGIILGGSGHFCAERE